MLRAEALHGAETNGRWASRAPRRIRREQASREAHPSKSMPGQGHIRHAARNGYRKIRESRDSVAWGVAAVVLAVAAVLALGLLLGTPHCPAGTAFSCSVEYHTKGVVDYACACNRGSPSPGLPGD